MIKCAPERTFSSSSGKNKAYVIPQRRSSAEEEEEAEEMVRLFREVFNSGGEPVKIPRLEYGDIFQSKYNFAHFWLSFVQSRPCGFARITQANPDFYKEIMHTRAHKYRGLVNVVFNTESALWEDEKTTTNGVTKHHQAHRFECKDAFDVAKVSAEVGSDFSVRACKSVFHPLLVMDFTRHLRSRLEERHFKERNDVHRLYYTTGAVIHEAIDELEQLELLSIQCWKAAVVNFRLPQMKCLRDKECTNKEMSHLLDFYH